MKPLHVPANFDKTAPIEEQVVFSLAYLGQASAAEVAAKLSQLDPEQPQSVFKEASTRLLQDLFDKGWINGVEQNGERYYNLNKEVKAHSGNIDPDKLDEVSPQK